MAANQPSGDDKVVAQQLNVNLNVDTQQLSGVRIWLLSRDHQFDKDQNPDPQQFGKDKIVVLQLHIRDQNVAVRKLSNFKSGSSSVQWGPD